ncbi:hypothetical protein ACF1BU_38325 [Streptomyces sp. NPDC014724]|uniref:hypothetical protein n=1 Tax=Streptomyces sp. NPDC014724 TaxID=3364882 RepID=UPI0003237DDB
MRSWKPETIICQYCSMEVVWLPTIYGGNKLFDAKMYPTSESARGNRFAAKRNGSVVDLDDIHSNRWPAECLHLHRYSCSEYNADMEARIWTTKQSPGRDGRRIAEPPF